MPESLGALINESSERLRQAGVPEPRRQALRIWSELTASTPGEALLERHRTIRASELADFRRAIQRRALGEPPPYVTGWAGFRHLILRSDRRALIPRPETEGLIDLLLQRVRSGVVADVGTGSGCIALSLALEGDFSSVVGVDCSRESLELARINTELLGLTGKVAFMQADLGTALRLGALDALISNPPYLTPDEYDGLDRSVRDWEPALALTSAKEGLEATERLLEDGLAALRPGGWLALEVDCSRAGIVARWAAELGWRSVSVHMDLFGRERYLLAQRSDTR
jgi:release factor glutamine methyltransferase